jgi:UDP-glucose 4-epimerase
MVEAIKTIIMNKGKDTAYNVSFGKSVRIIELLKTVQKITGASIEPKRRHERSGDIERSEVSNQKFVDAYGWKPKVELEAGLRELLYHYRTRV